MQEATSQAIVDFLLQPSAYPDRTTEIELRETHISWVFLTERLVYKLKKPVAFDFLDFSTAAQRRQACEDEVRLNRRLAGDVYLDVVPIVRNVSGALSLGGDGEEIDCVVKMRRLSDEESLQTRISTGRVSDEDARRIAGRLAKFYAGLPPAPIGPEKHRREIDQHVRGNRRTLLDAPDHVADATVKRIHTAQLKYLHGWPEVFDARVCDGRIAEGHGDLRPEHIYFTPEPIVIDCIEFNKEFRILDALDELCFLEMECAHQSAAPIGEKIMESYLEASGDRPPRELHSFYASYRACVRAKVSLLRAGQQAGKAHDRDVAEVLRYLAQADASARQLGDPSLLVVHGLAGVGKTTVARTVAERLGMEHLQTDAIRRQLFGEDGSPRSYGDGRYTAENRGRVYQEMFQQTDKLLSAGVSVVLDGTFITGAAQRHAADLARQHAANLLFVTCECPAEVAAERIAQRRASGETLSDAVATTHQQQRREADPLPTDLPACRVDTTEELPSMLSTVLKALRAVSK